jgi:ERCC4-type nuclease
MRTSVFKNAFRAQAGNLTIVPKSAAELSRGQLAIGGSNLSGNALTRRAGGHALVATGPSPSRAAPRVIVDVREFMSQLPAVLYGRGMEVVPLTLEVRP